MQVRYLSILWGLVALWAWYRMLKILSGDERVAVLAMGLMAVDFTVVWTCLRGPHGYDVRGVGRRGPDGLSDISRTQLHAGGAGEPELDCGGRIDPIRWPRATPAVCWPSRFTAIGSGSGLLHVLVAAAPYAVGAIGWGLYILQAPHEFMLQFGGNAAERGLPLNDPMAIIHSQIVVRFLYMFGMAPDTRGFSHIKILILAAYAAGVLGVVMNREFAANAACAVCCWFPA